MECLLNHYINFDPCWYKILENEVLINKYAYICICMIQGNPLLATFIVSLTILTIGLLYMQLKKEYFKIFKIHKILYFKRYDTILDNYSI